MAWNTANVGNFDPFAYPREYVGDCTFSGDVDMTNVDISGTLAVTGTTAFTGNTTHTGGLNATSAVRANSNSVSVICQPITGGGSSGGAPVNHGRIEFREAPAGDFTGTLHAALQVDASSGDLLIRGGADGTSAMAAFKADETVNWQARAHTNMASLGVGDVDATGIVDLTGQVVGVGASAALRNTYNQSVGTGVEDLTKTSGWISARRAGETDYAMIGGLLHPTDGNLLDIGGGITTLNAATHIAVWTGATTTTSGGTKRMEINSVGEVGFPSAVSGEKVHVTGDVGVSGTLSAADPTDATHVATRSWTEGLGLWQKVTYQLDNVNRISRATSQTHLLTLNQLGGTSSNKWVIHIQFMARTAGSTIATVVWLQAGTTTLPSLPVAIADVVSSMVLYEPNAVTWEAVNLYGIVDGGTDYSIYFMDTTGTSTAQFFSGTTDNLYSDIITGGSTYWVRTWARPLDDALTYT